MPAPTERGALLRKRLEQFTRMLHALEKGDVRGLHRTRVATRRLREVVPVLQLDSDLGAKLSRRLKKLTTHLGSVRELDALVLLIDELHNSDRYHPDALDRVAAVVDKERKRRRAWLMAKAPAAELQRLAKKLEDVVWALETSDRSRSPRRQSRRAWRWAVEARVARRAGCVVDAIDAAGAVYLPGRLHGLRITLKKLRYAVEIANDANGTRSKSDLGTLKHAQDLLGRLHDLQGLIDRARQVQASLAPPNLVTWGALEALVCALEDDCRRLHGRYMHQRHTLRLVAAKLGRRRARGQAAFAGRVTA